MNSTIATTLILPLLKEVNNTKVTDDHDMYNGMMPNLGFNVTFLIFWVLLLISHTAQLIYKQWFFSVAYLCCDVLEIVGFAGRVAGHFDVTNRPAYLAEMICLTIGPVFTMGGMYYQLAKLIEIYGHKYSLLKSSMAYSYIFTSADICSLFIQAAGGGIASSSGNTGKGIMIAGMVLQLLTMVIFLSFFGYFCYKVYIEPRLITAHASRISLDVLAIPPSQVDHFYREKFSNLRINPNRWSFQYFPLAFFAAIILVFIRCWYRFAEGIDGWDGYIITHEPFFIVLDALMMFLATTLMTIFHPGLAFNGRFLSIPITKGRFDPETLENGSEDEEKADSYQEYNINDKNKSNENLSDPTEQYVYTNDFNYNNRNSEYGYDNDDLTTIDENINILIESKK